MPHDDNVPHPPISLLMTQQPTRKAVSLDKPEDDYGATLIRAALAEFIVKWRNLSMTRQQIEQTAALEPIPFATMSVYHKAKFWLGDSNHHCLSSDEYDVIHARPSYHNTSDGLIPSRFDIVLVNGGQGNYIGLKGKHIYI